MSLTTNTILRVGGRDMREGEEDRRIVSQDTNRLSVCGAGSFSGNNRRPTDHDRDPRHATRGHTTVCLWGPVMPGNVCHVSWVSWSLIRPTLRHSRVVGRIGPRDVSFPSPPPQTRVTTCSHTRMCVGVGRGL